MSNEDKLFFKSTSSVPIPTKDILSAVFDKPSFSEDEPIYIMADDPRHSLSHRKCKSLVRKLIAGLRATSLKKGDCVCVHSFNNLYYSCLYLAVIGAGFVWTGTNPAYSKHELVHHFKTSKTKLLIVEPELEESVIPAAKEHGITESQILLFDGTPYDENCSSGSRSWRTLLNQGEQDWTRFDDINRAKATTACYLYSSGTTGLPKAACLSHYNLLAQHTLLHEQVKKPYKISRILCLPFFHAAMVPIGHITPLKAGHVSYVMRRFQLEEFLQYTEKYQTSEIWVVPPIIVTILQSPLTKKYSLKSLRCGTIGGAAIDILSQKEFSTLMGPDGGLNPSYGMTELSCLGTAYPWPEQDTDGSIGYFLPNLDVRLIDESGNDVEAYNKRGELWIRGPTVISCYLDNPEANASSFTGEWFHTGDIAYCDATSKKWYIVDRKKELIKVRGFQVAPVELEAVLMSHELILDAAVIGVPASSAVDGEAPRAYVVRKDDANTHQLNEIEVKQYIASRLAKYKQLSGGVVFVESLPKTASGKYLKRQLREQYLRERKSLSKL